MRQRFLRTPRLVTFVTLLWSFALLLTFTAVATGSQGVTTATAADDCQNFPETGFAVCGKFLQYWQSHGGLTQQGFPISGVFFEQQSGPPFGDGKVHKVQYFQRARFEEHTENAAPNDVLLGLLGTEQATAKYGPRTTGSEQPQPGCQFFPETGYNVCGAFLLYWQTNGGLAQQGFPISDVTTETNQPPPSGDGKAHQVQYFQRARFEEHLELNGQTLLGLLGGEQFKTKYPANPPAAAPPPASNPTQPPATQPAPAPQPTPKPPAPPTSPPATQPAPAAGVQFVSVQGNSPGRNASVTVQTAANAACSIDYYTPKGTHSVAAGLYDKNADGNGRVSWTWLIGGNTTRGTGTVTVSCGGARASTDITIG